MRRWMLWLWWAVAWPLAAAERAEDGVWWNPDASGTGFQIERQGDTYTMAFYLYEPDGSQLWLTSVATWEAMPDRADRIGRLHGTLYRARDGQCLGCAYRAPSVSVHEAGSFTLEFDSAASGVLSWGGTTMPVQRALYAWPDRLDRFSGRWLLTERDGETPASTRALRGMIEGADAVLRDDAGTEIARVRRDGLRLRLEFASTPGASLPLSVAERDRFVASDGATRSVIGVRTDDVALDEGLAAPAGEYAVRIDAGLARGPIKRLLGVNKGPLHGGRRAPNYSYDSSAGYRAFGVQSVRLHDVGVDLCEIYRDARIENLSAQPPTTLSACVNTPSGPNPRVAWTVNDPGGVDNAANYDFSAMDASVREVLAVGARVYLRLGESFNGPNDSRDLASWARVAGNVYRHLVGDFAASTDARADPEFIEIHNEPDGMFWNGANADFHELFRATSDQLRSHAAAGGRHAAIGGPGFTHDVVRGMATPGSLTQGFVAAVGSARLDFFSAHYYGDCAAETPARMRDWLRTLRQQLDGQGLAATPLHVSEWNIGLGQACGDALFDDRRVASFVARALVLLHEDEFGVEAAHYYAGTTVMSLFHADDGSAAIDLRPGAWGFWAHHQLNGGTRLHAETCRQGVCGDYADAPDAPAVLAARVGNGLRLLVTNDSAISRSLRVQIHNIEPASSARVRSAPSQASLRLGTALQGHTVAITEAGIQEALARVSETSVPTQRLGARSLGLDLSLPAHAVQVIDIP